MKKKKERKIHFYNDIYFVVSHKNCEKNNRKMKASIKIVYMLIFLQLLDSSTEKGQKRN